MHAKNHIRIAVSTLTVIMLATALLVGPAALAQNDRRADMGLIPIGEIVKSVEAVPLVVEAPSTRKAPTPLPDPEPAPAAKSTTPEAVAPTGPDSNLPATDPAPVEDEATVQATAQAVQEAAVDPAAAQSELARARAILAGYVGQYPILSGTTISFGDTPGGYQAVAYYTSGRILVSPDHTASLERIIGHEIWHIIDYRDNGVIDWGENVPPAGY